MERVNLDALEAALAKATPGPWSVDADGRTDDILPCYVIIPEINRILHSIEWPDPEDLKQDMANAEAIVASYNALPALIAELRELREEAARARWCEENKAAVRWSQCFSDWTVSWAVGAQDHAVSDPDRNAAIDAAAMGRKG